MLPCHSCHIYTTWKNIYVGGKRFWSYHIWEGKVKKGWDHFYRVNWLLKTPCKDFNLAFGGGLGWLRMGEGKVYISCNYTCTISSLVKILLVKLKYLYIQYAWISIMKKQNSNQYVKVEKIVVLLTITI